MDHCDNIKVNSLSRYSFRYSVLVQSYPIDDYDDFLKFNACQRWNGQKHMFRPNELQNEQKQKQNSTANK